MTTLLVSNQQKVKTFLLANPFSTYRQIMEAHPTSITSIQLARLSMQNLMKHEGYCAEVRSVYGEAHTRYEYALSRKYSGEPRVICIDPKKVTQLEEEREVYAFLREISAQVLEDLLYYLYECRYHYVSFHHLAKALETTPATIQRWCRYASTHGADIHVRGKPHEREIKLIKFGKPVRYRKPVVPETSDVPREQALWKNILNKS